ncbi:hypothetical protein [Clostridioides sp. ZZV15-6598]|uniref:hypothetical protein n=1 Tax=Clostridioides sp. ZZV15-6598 TaxID=2811501 RepID=UPI001D0FED1B|nr:hypothetical protein [Clostridioides sp. ZZV15-6598]
MLTKRCKIRRFQESDIDIFMSYRNDEQWMKYQEFKGLTKNEYSKVLISKNSFEEGIQLAILEKHQKNLLAIYM